MTTRGDRRGLLRRATLSRGVLPYTLAVYSGGSLPLASLWTGAHIYVSDDISGGVEAFSDGINWRRVTDRAVVQPVVSARLYAVGSATGDAEGRAGPYLRGAGIATGTFAGGAIAAAAMSGAGAAVATLQTPPKVPTDLSADGVAIGTMCGAARASAAMSATGTAAGVCSLVGVAV